ncbi:Crp/Fnr family transcriptional regulator [bacterium]|nr:Crp/Fnr family transcriptional regulator [bacterium]
MKIGNLFTNEIIIKLGNCLLFNGIKTKELSALLNCMQSKVIEFDKNKTVMQEGKVFNKLGILLAGNLQVVQYDYLGNRTIISTVEPLQIFGEAFSYVKTKFPMNVETTEKSQVLFLISDRISNPCQNGCIFHKQLINNLLHILAHKNVNLTQKIECMSKRTTKEKLLTFLTLESIKQNSKEFTISLDRQALADYLGVERSAMSAELSKLRNDGIIECEKNWFRLL